jgi:hypothetical protein
MPRMIELIRKSQMSANMMQAAARGALMVPPGEMIEILVHLAQNNKVFGEQARMTLAGWDEKASIAVASDPATPKDVLDYLISAKNLRPSLLPALLGNPSISDEELADLAANASRTIIEGMLLSPRIKNTPLLAGALRSNPRLRANEIAELSGSPSAPAPAAMESPAAAQPSSTAAAVQAPVASPAKQAESSSATAELASGPEGEQDDPSVVEAVVQAIAQYMDRNATEIASEGDKPFEAVRMSNEDVGSGEQDPVTASAPAAEESVPTSQLASAKPTTTAVGAKAKKPQPEENRRDSTLQKISRLDIKGRIALAMRGSKEERSILIRDGTKLVALAVLDSPKISDGEVEKFALQKNVLEAVLRAIPLKRRFAKSYVIMRNLVYNPRTPLDLSLSLMKNLLIHDLKNLSENKEVSETIRKLALRMYKQKKEQKND